MLDCIYNLNGFGDAKIRGFLSDSSNGLSKYVIDLINRNYEFLPGDSYRDIKFAILNRLRTTQHGHLFTTIPTYSSLVEAVFANVLTYIDSRAPDNFNLDYCRNGFQRDIFNCISNLNGFYDNEIRSFLDDSSNGLLGFMKNLINRSYNFLPGDPFRDMKIAILNKLRTTEHGHLFNRLPTYQSLVENTFTNVLAYINGRRPDSFDFDYCRNIDNGFQKDVLDCLRDLNGFRDSEIRGFLRDSSRGLFGFIKSLINRNYEYQSDDSFRPMKIAMLNLLRNTGNGYRFNKLDNPIPINNDGYSAQNNGYGGPNNNRDGHTDNHGYSYSGLNRATGGGFVDPMTGQNVHHDGFVGQHNGYVPNNNGLIAQDTGNGIYNIDPVPIKDGSQFDVLFDGPQGYPVTDNNGGYYGDTGAGSIFK